LSEPPQYAVGCRDHGIALESPSLGQKAPIEGEGIANIADIEVVFEMFA